MKFSDSFMTEDIKLLGQRQRTLLLKAQQASWASCLHWFSLPPNLMKATWSNPGGCYVLKGLCHSQGIQDSETWIFYPGCRQACPKFSPEGSTIFTILDSLLFCKKRYTISTFHDCLVYKHACKDSSEQKLFV